MADGSGFLPFTRELVVDLFAGGGGASTGIARAYREPDVAVNHDRIAIAVHRANHPDTEHFIKDVFEVDPLTATRGRPVGLLWASPDCRHHSKAKGKAPRSRHVRGLAWVVVRWALACSPRLVELENVEEFVDWGPLDDDGAAIKARRGETFRAFIAAMSTGLRGDHPAWPEIMEFLGVDAPVPALVRGLGYSADWREIRACDKGAPTIRKRLVVKLRRDGLPITWSPDTHAAPDSEAVRAGRLQPWRTAAEFIDWSLPACSIFATPAEARAWAREHGQRGVPRRPLAEATLRRIARGLWRHVLAAERPYIVQPEQEEGDHGGESLGGGRAASRHAAGCGGRAGHDLPRGGTDEFPQRLHEHAGRLQYVQDLHAGNAVEGRADGGLRTADGGVRLSGACATACLTEFANASSQRTFAADEPLRTQVAQVKGGHFAVAAATMIQTGYGEREGQAPRVLELGKPLGTAVAGGVKHAVATAFLEQANGGFYEGAGRSLAEPTSTILQSGSHQQLVSAYLVKFYKSGGQWQDCTDPMHTVPTRDRMGLVQVANVPAGILAPELHARAKAVARFLHEYLPEHFPEPADMVLVGDHVMVDITLRMLVPRELARAQGFPDTYVIEWGLFETEPGSGIYERRPISKTDQVRLIGNSVCPDMAEAEIANDLAPLIRHYAREAA